MSIENVRAYFRQFGMEDRVMEKEHSSARRLAVNRRGSPRRCHLRRRSG